MLDPQAECPDCGARLGNRPDCRACGWTPARVEPVKKATPSWEPTPYTPPTPEEQVEVRALIAETAAKLGAAAKEIVERKPLAYLPARCPQCASGKFVHMGVRFCLSCYAGMKGA